jgi:hypothetical protein
LLSTAGLASRQISESVPAEIDLRDAAGSRAPVPLRQERADRRAVVGPACVLIGSQVAMDVVHYLSGICDPATLGASLTLDLRTMAIGRESVESIPDCEICGPPSAFSTNGHA